VTNEQLIGFVLALTLMCVGFLGNLIPVIPGTPVVLIAAVAHRLYFGPDSIGYLVLTLLIALTAISLILDYLATYYGAKRLGATWRGGVGAAIGGIVGLFFGIPGILVGPFLGAMLFELIGGHAFRKAARAGVGATLGLLASAVGKSGICVLMIGLFVINVLFRTTPS
jgi:uncharacterized protein YqgC (DUF456 family)